MVQDSKTALVTGASRGIRRATALALAEMAHMYWFTTAAPPRKPSLWSRVSTQKGAAPTQ
jgi:NAD(P)-dependent dehydrogenase (short-subunit alcohol dehydrogenase family)